MSTKQDVPTAELKFVDGVLHQQFVRNEGGSAYPVWLPVPQETTAAPVVTTAPKKPAQVDLR